MDTIDIPLSSLKRDPANARKTELAPLKSFVASVREHGILEPLTVRDGGDGYYFVTNGGKRLAALDALLKDKIVAPDIRVPCILREVSDTDALDISLAMNHMREDMHPVDEYEAFAKLIEDGATEEDIRKRYGLTQRGLAQSLALGRLSPAIRKAWAAGELEEEVARAFTLEPDQKRQEEIFNRNFGKRKGGANAYMIRQAIVGDGRTAGAMLRFVELDAYRDAGGATTEDLFSDEKGAGPMATDQALLKKLYDQKIKDRVKELKAEGWKWVEYASDLSSMAWYWPSVAKTKIKAEDRGKYGVIVNVNQWSAEVEFKYGVQKPSAASKAAKKPKNDGAGPDVAISAALCCRLSDQVTQAAASVLKSDNNLALAVLAASLLSEGSCPSDIRSSRVSNTNEDIEDEFAQNLAVMRKKSLMELVQVLTDLAAHSLGLGGGTMQNLPLAESHEDDRALLEALDGKKLNAALRTMFDAQDYFSGLNREAIVLAIKEIDGAQPVSLNAKKGDLVTLATTVAQTSNANGKPGYLPPEMRTSSYDGPRAKPAKPEPAPKAARKAPTKKEAVAKKPAKKAAKKKAA